MKQALHNLKVVATVRKTKIRGLLFLRRITPLPRREAVYFCSGVYMIDTPGEREIYFKCD